MLQGEDYSISFDSEGVIINVPLSIDPDAWSRFKSLNEVDMDEPRYLNIKE